MAQTGMTADEVREALRQKIELRWSEYQTEMLQSSPADIFSRAGEIATAQFCHEQFTEYLNCYAIEDLEYLLRFDNPLTVVRDQWISEQSVDYSDEFEHALWTLQNTQDAEQNYPLDPDWNTGHTSPSLC